MDPERGVAVSPGDVLKVERRYLVGGVVTTITDEGRFGGVELVGTSEHLVLEDTARKETRLFPMSAISEITVLEHTEVLEVTVEEQVAPTRPPWDPSIA